jgi:lysophospholipase L1-like esterase
VYGDSMTAGFPSYEPYAKSLASTLAAAGVSVEVVGCGLCGLTAVEMARGLDAQQLRDNFGRVGPGLGRLLAEQGPFDLVLVMAGTNDLGVPQTSAEEVLASLQCMHKACWAVGAPSLALSVPESSVTGTAQYPVAAAKWHAINNALAAWGQRAQGENPCNSPFFVNTAELVSFNRAACMRGLWDPDNLHFTAAGSREFGNKLAPLIASRFPEGQAVPVEKNTSALRQLTPERTISSVPATSKDQEQTVRSTTGEVQQQKKIMARTVSAISVERNGSQLCSARKYVRSSSIAQLSCCPPIANRHWQNRVAVY